MDKQIYEMCIKLAKESPCQKKGFGSVLKLADGAQFFAFNASSEVTKHICDGECIRFQIPSGADSLIGSCFHSEELAVWGAINAHHSVIGAVLYVAPILKPVVRIPVEEMVREGPIFAGGTNGVMRLYSIAKMISQTEQHAAHREFQEILI